MIEVEGALLRLQEQFQKVSTPTEVYPSIHPSIHICLYMHTISISCPYDSKMLLPSPDIALEMNFEFDVARVGFGVGPVPQAF